MNNSNFWQVSILRFGLFLGVLLLFSSKASGQCSCGTNPDVYPVNQNHHYYPLLDANGFVTSYSYRFQFSCMGDPLPLNGQYEYKIVYREKGTTAWTVVGGHPATLFSGHPIFKGLLIGIGNLKPCKVYEFRVTCPKCVVGPNCDSQDQLDAYLNDEDNNALNNVTRIWEVCYNPIESQPINNFMVSSIDMQNSAVTLKWDHLPALATYHLEYRKKSDFNWMPIGTTDQYEMVLSGLESCKEYVVRIRGTIDNCCGGTTNSVYSSFEFMMTDCMSNIKSVDFVTGNSARVIWAPIGTNPIPNEYEVRWWKYPTGPPSSATVNSTNYTITGLQPYIPYYVQIFSKCEPQSCPGDGYSKKQFFYTNCELSEPNNTFQTATPVSFDANHSNVNITPAGDIDFYKFTPTVCEIEIKIDRPNYDEIGYFLGMCYAGAGLPYILYDQNYQEVKKSQGYKDSQNCFHDDTHWVTPGQDYYLAINGWSDFYQSLDCYTFNAFPCLGCEVPSNNFIEGEDNIYTLPKTRNYALDKIVFQVEWSVDGPADLGGSAYPNNCELSFYDVGTVVLTATISHCDGTTEIITKEIIVSDECNIVGTYSNAYSGWGLSQGINLIEKGNQYVITLDIPEGITFMVYSSGGVSWVVDGNSIIVNQTSTAATFRIVLFGGNCDYTTGFYTFIKWFIGNPLVYPVEWGLSPNPASDVLQITPTILPEVDPSTLPESVDIRLFNQNSNLVISQQGSTATPTSLNMANLQPGSYSLQLLYGGYWQQYTVMKQ